MFDLDSLAATVGREAVARLRKKLAGGRGNSEGYEFELFNCVVEIVDCAFAYDQYVRNFTEEGAEHPSEVHLTQGALAFVDDILVETPGLLRFIQVKNNADLTWYQELHDDFDFQHKWMIADQRRFRTELVVNSQRLRRNLTSGKSSHTFAKAHVVCRDPTDTAIVSKKLETLIGGVPTRGNVRLLEDHIKIAWLRSPRAEYVAATLARTKEITNGIVRAFQVSPPALVAIIEKIREEDPSVLELSADGLTIYYHISDDDDEWRGFVGISDPCSLAEILTDREPSNAVELIRLFSREM